MGISTLLSVKKTEAFFLLFKMNSDKEQIWFIRTINNEKQPHYICCVTFHNIQRRGIYRYSNIHNHDIFTISLI